MEKLKELITVKNVSIAAAVLALVFIFITIVSWGSNSNEPSAAPAPSPTVTAESNSPAPSATSEPTVTSQPEETTSSLYADCAAVWAVLERPITKDDEGFPATSPNIFDLDSDGIGCEDNPSTPEDESEVDWQAIWEQTKGNAEDFADWATPKLRDFWNEIAAPGIADTWETLKRNW